MNFMHPDSESIGRMDKLIKVKKVLEQLLGSSGFYLEL